MNNEGTMVTPVTDKPGFLLARFSRKGDEFCCTNKNTGRTVRGLLGEVELQDDGKACIVYDDSGSEVCHVNAGAFVEFDNSVMRLLSGETVFEATQTNFEPPELLQ